MYFVFIIKTRHKSVSPGNSKITRKEMPKLPFAEMKLDEMLEKKRINKKMMDFDYRHNYLRSISNKILLWQR